MSGLTRLRERFHMPIDAHELARMERIARSMASGCDLLSECLVDEEVYLEGVVWFVHLGVEKAYTQVGFDDGTARLVLHWSGRPDVPVLGSFVRVRGRLEKRQGAVSMYNPQWEAV